MTGEGNEHCVICQTGLLWPVFSYSPVYYQEQQNKSFYRQNKT